MQATANLGPAAAAGGEDRTGASLRLRTIPSHRSSMLNSSRMLMSSSSGRDVRRGVAARSARLSAAAASVRRRGGMTKCQCAPDIARRAFEQGRRSLLPALGEQPGGTDVDTVNTPNSSSTP